MWQTLPLHLKTRKILFNVIVRGNSIFNLKLSFLKCPSGFTYLSPSSLLLLQWLCVILHGHVGWYVRAYKFHYIIVFILIQIVKREWYILQHNGWLVEMWVCLFSQPSPPSLWYMLFGCMCKTIINATIIWHIGIISTIIKTSFVGCYVGVCVIVNSGNYWMTNIKAQHLIILMQMRVHKNIVIILLT